MRRDVRAERSSPRSTTARAFACIATIALVITGNPLSHTAGASSGPLPAAGIAIVDASGGATTTGLIGENAHLQATFTNTSATLSDVGYGPYIDLILPTSGADGIAVAPGADGISFVTATYLGVTMQTQQLVCPAGGSFGSHPITGSVGPSCSPGDTLVVIRYPIGSYAPGNPALVADITLHTSGHADVGTALTIAARSGFEFGASPSGSPVTNNAPATQTLTPQLYTITTTYNGQEHETATGPNFVQTYTVSADLSNGQTLTNFVLRDLLPPGFAYVNPPAPLSWPAGASITLEPNRADTTAEPGSATNGISATDNLLEALWPTVTGSSSATDATLTFSYFVPKIYNANQPTVANNNIVDAASGDDVALQNTATSQADWVPTDNRDIPQTVSAVPVHDPMTAKSIAVQKHVVIATDTGSPGATPDDIVKYTIDVQISDYFNFTNVTINSDVLGDGQTMLTEADAIQYRPTVSINEAGSTTNGAFSQGDTYTVDTTHRPSQGGDCSNGSGTSLGATMIDFNISGAITAASPGLGLPNGELTGDLAKDTTQSSATTAQISFWAHLDDSFDCQAGNLYVDQTDHMTNDVTITADLLDGTDSPLGTTEADTSATRLDIVAGSLAKTIYARNGVVGTYPTGSPFSPGDTITYRIKYLNTISDMENFSLNDYLPLPVMLSSELSTVEDTHPVDDPGSYSSAAPPAGTIKWGPTDTFGSDTLWGRAGSHPFPTLNTIAANNSFALDFGTFNSNTNAPSVVDILYTVTLTDSVFSPGLALTNLVQANFNNTSLEASNTDATATLQLSQPNLSITKGVVATDQVDDQHPTPPSFTPAVSNGPWSTPGTLGPRFSGTIDSANLNINSNASGIDAGDIVTFAVAIENTGVSRKGAFDVVVNDTLPTGFQIPSGGLNLNVSDGTGATIGTTTHGAGFFDANGGLELNDPGPTTASPDDTNAGSLDPYDPTNGHNIAIITYDLAVAGSVEIGSTLPNTATITQYHGTEGGGTVNYADILSQCGTPPCYTHPSDAASVTIANLSAQKTIVGGDNTHTLGETYQYQATISVPEGTTSGLTVVDTLDSGLAFVSLDSINAPNLSTNASGGFAGALATPTISTVGSSPLGDGRRVSIDLGDVTNADNDNTSLQTITITYTVVVLNTSINQAAQTRGNSIIVSSFASNATATATNITVVEPTLTISKTATPITGDAHDAVQYDILVTNPSTVPAYDVELSDSLPISTTFDATFGTSGFDLSHCNATPTSGPAETGGTVSTAWSTLAPGETCTITLQAIVNADVTPKGVVANTANLDWTSLPGTVQDVSAYNSLSDERTGSGAVNDYAAMSTANLTIAPITALKSVIATSEPTTSAVGNLVSVGEQLTYEITVTIPEGISPNLTVVDSLPPALAVATDVSGIVVTADPDIVLAHSTGNPVIAAVGGTNGRKLSFDFGDVVNNANNDGNAETIIITYIAVVVDAAGATRGVTAQNSVVITWGGNPGGTITIHAPAQTVVEPTLKITSSTSAPGPFAAGSAFSYQFSVAHTASSNSDAFDVAFTDQLPNEVSIAGPIVQTGGPVCTFVHDGSTNGGVVSGTCAHFATTDPTLTFTVPVIVNVNAASGATVNNTSNVVWTSTANNLDSTAGGNSEGHERTDLGGIDDYSASHTVSFVVPSIALNKSMVGTSEADTTGNEVAIGEVVTYQLQLDVPQGHTDGVVVADTLDQGLAFVDVTSITSDSNVSLHGGTAGTPPTGFVTTISNVGAGPVNQGRSLTIVLGDITNTALDSNPEYVTIQYRAVVLNASVNVRGHTLGNTATVDWNDNPSATPEASASTPAPMSVVESSLTITKSAMPTAGDAGNAVTFTIRVDHTVLSNADAHDVVFTDTIPAGLTFDGIPTVLSTGGANNVGVGSPTFSSGVLTVPIGTIAENGASDEYSEFTFTTTIATSAVAGSTITNSGSATWQSIDAAVLSAATDHNPIGVERTGTSGDPGDLNPYSATATASVTIGAPAIAKTLTDPTHTTHAIGDLLQYDVSLTFPEGTTNGVTIDDTLDAGLALVRIDSVTPSSSALTSSLGAFSDPSNFATTVASGGGSFNMNLGDLTNTDTTDSTAETIVVTYSVVILNSPMNQDGQLRGNQAHATYDPGSGAVALANVSAPNITVVEPDLSMTKAATPATVDSGDTITYTIHVAHTAASTSTAYDVAFTDALPQGTSFVAGSVVPISGVVPSAGTSTAGTLTISISAIPLGSQSTFTFQLLVGASATAGSTIHNVGNTAWTSVAGSVDPAADSFNALGVERTGSISNAGGNSNDYVTNAAADVAMTQPTFNKVLTDPLHTSVAVGAITQYDVRFTVPEGTTTQLHFDDTLDTGLAFVRVDQVIAPSGVTTNYAGGFAQSIADAEAGVSNSGRTISMLLGDITNTNSSNTTPEVLTVRYSVIALDVATNQRGHTMTNHATADYDDGTATATLGTSIAAAVAVVEPTLVTTKSSDKATADAGDTVTYTVSISHAGGSDGNGYNVAFRDPLPAFSSYVAGSAVTLVGSAPESGFSESGGTLAATWDAIALGETRTFTYQATLDSNVPAGASMVNAASIDWESVASVPADSAAHNTAGHARDGSDGPGGILNDYATTAAATVDVVTPPSTKGLATTSIAGTVGNDVVAGEVATYYLRLQLPEGNISSTVVDDTVPNGMSFVAGSVAMSTSSDPLLSDDFNGTIGVPTVSTTGQLLQLQWGTTTVVGDNIPTNNYVIVRYQARVDVTVSPGDTLTNGATIALDGGAALAMAPVDLHVVAPNVSIAKEVSNDGTHWSTALDTEPNAGSPQLYYRIAITNLGTADAYDVTVVDNTPTTPVAPFINLSVDTIAGTTVVDGEVAIDPDLEWNVASIAAGATTTLTYHTDLINSSHFNEGDVLTNTVSAPSYWAAPAADRVDPVAFTEYTADPTATSSVTLHFPQVTLTKTTGQSNGLGAYIDLPSLGNAQLGQPFPWRVTVANASTFAAAHNVNIQDVLPPGWTFVAGSATFSAGSASQPTVTGAPQTLDWIVDGTGHEIVVPAGGSLTIAFDAIPSLDAKAQADPHVNTASVTLTDSSGAPANHSASYNPPSDSAAAHLQLPDLHIAKTPDGDHVAPNAIAQWTIKISNRGDASAHHVIVTDSLPPEVTLDVAHTAPTPISVTTDSGHQTIVWNLGTIASHGVSTPPHTRLIVVGVHVHPESTGNLDNISEVRSDEYDPHGPPAGSDPGQLVVDPDAPSFASHSTKSATPPSMSSVTAASTIGYQLSYENDGPGDATGVTVTDLLPAQVDFVAHSATPASLNTHAVEFCVTCDGSDWTPSEMTGVRGVRWHVGAVAAQAPLAIVSFNATVQSGIDAGTRIVNAGSLTSDQTPDGITLGPVEHTLAGDPHLVLLKGVDRNAINLDTETNHIAYSVAASNAGGVTAHNTQIVDHVPYGTTLTTLTNGGYTVDCSSNAGAGWGTCPSDLSIANAIRWTIGNLATASTSSAVGFAVAIQLPAVNGASIENRAQATSDETGNVDSNQVQTIVTAHPQLSIDKSVSPTGTSKPGTTLRYSLTYGNHGTADAINVMVADPIPSHTTFVAGSATGSPTYVVAGIERTSVPTDLSSIDALRWHNTTLPRGASRTESFRVKLDPAINDNTNILNNATVSGDNGTSRSDSANITVDSAPRLELQKLAATNVVAIGDAVTYTLTVSNIGNATAQHVELDDPLPSGLHFVAASSAATLNAGTVTWPIFDLDSGHTRVFTLTTKVASTGSFTNVATAHNVLPAGGGNGQVLARSAATIESQPGNGLAFSGSNSAMLVLLALAGVLFGAWLVLVARQPRLLGAGR